MKNMLIIGLFLFSNATYALTDNVIELITEPSFNKSLCGSISQLKVQEISKEEVNRFKIDNGDYVTIQLNGKNKTSCYSFKYYPETSSSIDLSIKNNTLSILEMVGSTINGNWLKKTYQINIKNKFLIKKQAKAISFSTDEKGKIYKDVSDW
ncbi:hypothetical protein [Acinetobacter sp.]|jgi:hypothetical protein|uniref:hypothetical protein n=1 Tax=Acinetobacter sp. TaxID=472 RepID=UPI00333EC4C4